MTTRYDQAKTCPVCDETFYRDTEKTSPATWASRVFCKPACARQQENVARRANRIPAKQLGKPVGTPNRTDPGFDAPTGFDRDWRSQAACLGMTEGDLFFPVGTSGPAQVQIAEAKAVCRRCPVRPACLTWALETGTDTGVWGGMSEDERRALTRRNARPRARTS